jgi:hypothetical protein
MVHVHRPLGDGVKREGRAVHHLALERRIPEGQRVEMGLDPLARAVGRLAIPVPLRGKAEALQRLAIKLKDRGLGDRRMPFSIPQSRYPRLACLK